MHEGFAVRSERHILAAVVAVTTACAAAAVPAVAQSYPAKSVRIVVPFPPGGTSDILSRVIGQRLTDRWGQQIVVENRTGASGAIGSEAVLRAAADGYTLLLTDVGSVMLSQLLAAKPAFDIAKDYAPITLVSYSPHLLCIHQSVPVKNVPELIALAKRRSQEFNYASSPAGAPYMAGLLFSHQAGIKWNYITGKGGSQSVMDVITGQADIVFNGMLATLPHVKNGRIRLLAVSSEKRMESLPDIPAVAETLPGFVTGSWQGLLAPPSTPADIVNRLQADVTRVLALPDLREKLQAQGADPLPMSSTDTTKFLVNERDRWAKLIRETGYKLAGAQ